MSNIHHIREIIGYWSRGSVFYERYTNSSSLSDVGEQTAKVSFTWHQRSSSSSSSRIFNGNHISAKLEWTALRSCVRCCIYQHAIHNYINGVFFQFCYLTYTRGMPYWLLWPTVLLALANDWWYLTQLCILSQSAAVIINRIRLDIILG